MDSVSNPPITPARGELSMGWNWRKSIRMGPLRVNLSKSGVGYSIGVPGLRLGKDAKGRSYRSVGLPGTGIYRRDYLANAVKHPAKPSTTAPTGVAAQRSQAKPGRIAVAALYFGG